MDRELLQTLIEQTKSKKITWKQASVASCGNGFSFQCDLSTGNFWLTLIPKYPLSSSEYSLTWYGKDSPSPIATEINMESADGYHTGSDYVKTLYSAVYVLSLASKMKPTEDLNSARIGLGLGIKA